MENSMTFNVFLLKLSLTKRCWVLPSLQRFNIIVKLCLLHLNLKFKFVLSAFLFKIVGFSPNYLFSYWVWINCEYKAIFLGYRKLETPLKFDKMYQIMLKLLSYKQPINILNLATFSLILTVADKVYWLNTYNQWIAVLKR